ncbi:efflux RND transporter periplasmic adaptor subunit [Paludibacterium yongneupense]|uniref:efflux RND transporter periplasmic adaptor subunit n=1 Tax=Paludibacterium yongneupense TaxID=400061 RepID=UPI00048B3280|nr:efflux RND transporter periplasmic adaptor subunit [Paludibacterium yongneupense]
MTKRMLIMLGGVVLLVVVLGLGFFLHIKKLMAAAPKPGAQTVTATVVKGLEWQPQLVSVGTLTAVHGVDISSEVAGQVRSVDFKSGQDVKAGAVLLQLNADSDIAQLHSLQAAAELSATTLKRDQAQLAVQGVSQAQVDSDTADLKSKNALVAQQAALVAKKTIHAPFSGRLGITTVNPGQYLNPGDKIVTLQAIDPIYVDFYLPQRKVGELSVGQTVSARSDSFAGLVFSGKISAISPKVDPSTRNVQVEATVANPKRQLLPGMFANASVDVGSKQRYLTLPQTAVTYNPYGSTVFVVKPSKADPKTGAVDGGLEVQQVFVVTGETRGDQVAIVKGLQEGQQVVTSGQIKLKNGTPVVIDNSVLPSNSPNPAPQEQ